MSATLEKARQQFEAGNYKAAVATMWDVERDVRGGDDTAGAQGLLDLATALREQAGGKFRSDCDALCGYARKALDQGVRRGIDLRGGALAVLSGCRLLGAPASTSSFPRKGPGT